MGSSACQKAGSGIQNNNAHGHVDDKHSKDVGASKGKVAVCKADAPKDPQKSGFVKSNPKLSLDRQNGGKSAAPVKDQKDAKVGNGTVTFSDQKIISHPRAPVAKQPGKNDTPAKKAALKDAKSFGLIDILKGQPKMSPANRFERTAPNAKRPHA